MINIAVFFSCAEISSSSKGPSGTVVDIVYETDDKKSHKLAIVRALSWPPSAQLLQFDCVRCCGR